MCVLLNSKNNRSVFLFAVLLLEATVQNCSDYIILKARGGHKETASFFTSAIQKSVSSVFRFFFPTEMYVGKKLEAEHVETSCHLFIAVARQEYLFIRMYM